MTHTDGARGVLLELGGGWQLELWHLNRYIISEQWTAVAVGQALGVTGKSGQVSGAHTHIELKLNGTRRNPEPFLPMPEREALAIPGATAGTGTFRDVPPTHAHFADIEWAYRVGLTSGIGNGLFGPEEQVTRAQLATFLRRFNNLLREP
jgi:hypothetical protein